MIEQFQSRHAIGGNVSTSEQRVQKDSVLPSEFFEIPVTNRNNGLSGYFVSPYFGANRATIAPELLDEIVVPQELENEHTIVYRPERDQWFKEWNGRDLSRLKIQQGMSVSEASGESRKLRLRRKDHEDRKNVGQEVENVENIQSSECA